MTDQPRCTRVTGKAFEPYYWTLPEERQGPKRPEREERHGGVTVRDGRVRTLLPRLEAVYDVLCGDPVDYWVKKEGLHDPVNCCSRCLSAIVDQQGPTVTVGVRKRCPETDEFGGRCAYALNHNSEMNHRFLGGDEEARHQAAIEAYHQEKAEA